MQNKTIYKKAVAEVVLFDNRDVITTSGGNACVTWTSENGFTCNAGLQFSDGPDDFVTQ